MAESVDTIHSRMLSNISDEYDKSEGSFFYDAEKPVAIELERLNIKAESILNKGFADTAMGSDLDRICAEQGVYRKLVTKSSGLVTVTGVVGAIIKKGEIVASDSVNFIFTEDRSIPSDGLINVNVECEQYGTIGNVPVGAIKYFPTTLEGLYTVNNSSAFTNGYDSETDESLRERYYAKIRTPATSGNKWHYLNWAKEVTGVGDAKVFPLWNGNRTVKVVIINSNKRAADSALIDDVFTHIEDNRPIGATVTVISGREKIINISTILVVDTKEYTLNQVKTYLENNITRYFKDIAFKNNYVSYANIGNLIFNTDGVIDYSNLVINGGTSNILLEDEEIPVLGDIELGV